MEHDKFLNMLNENDFHIDPLGRIVIDNPEILAAINGAVMPSGSHDEAMFNGGCSNSGCG